MANLGTLSLDVVAKIGGFTAGLDKAEREAKKRAAAIEKAFESAFAGITAGFAIVASAGVGALALVNAQAETIAGFQDLSDKIGDSAEAIAALQSAATLSGTSIDEVAAASVRLTSALAKTDDESKGVGAALKAIGIEMEAFKQLSPVAQLEAVAKALGQFEDGAGKTAAATMIFGKAGADLLKFLKDLEEQGGRTAGLTREQIAAADDYTKATARLRGEFTLFVQQQSAELIPILSQVQSLLAEVAKNESVVEAVTGTLNVAIKTAITVFQTLAVVASDVGFVLLGVGREIGAVAAQAAALARLDFKGFNAISEAVKEDGKRARAELDRFQKQVMQIGQPAYVDDEIRRLQNRNNAANNPNKPRLRIPNAPTGGGGKAGGATDDPTKKLLDNQLKEFDRYINAERDLMSQRNKFLDIYNQQGLVSIKDYYDAQQSILDEGTRKQVEAYQKQIDAIKAYQAGLPAKGKDTERADAQGKINDLLDKQAKLQQSAGLSALEMGIRQQQAVKEYRDALTDLQAQVQEMNGNLGAAAGLRFDQSNDRRRQMFTAEGNTEAVKALDSLKQYQVTQAELNKLQQQFALTQGDLQLSEERITMARERGTMGEIESLQKSGEARRQQYAILQQQIKAFDQLKMSMTLTPEQLQQYDRLKLQLDQLGSTLDPLADKFDTLFQDKASDAFSDFITGAKSAKDAFKSFADSFAQEVQRMFIKDLAKQLFGGDGGIGSWFSKTLGGSSGGKAGGGFDISKLFSSFAGLFAEGGSIRSGQWGIAGEAGPEVIRGPATVIPMTRMAGAGSTNINVNVLPGATRETGYQAAREMARELSRSGRR